MTRSIIVAGTCGTGKSTVGQILAEKLGMKFVEGDELHPAANVAKMGSGVPLTDEDRWGWLEDVATKSHGSIASCSALTRRYRDYLRRYCNGLVIVFLHDSEERLHDRMSSRQGHFMGARMLASQLELMDLPTDDEPDTLKVATTKPPEELCNDIIQYLQQI